MSLLAVSRRMPMYALLGVVAGLGVLLMRVSEAHSYLSEDSRTCINCHAMVPQYATWERSAHAKVTVCIDCHVPHDSLMRKHAFKARDGMRHSAIFALRREPQVIRASPTAEHVIQENCVRCHQEAVSRVGLSHGGERSCVECHRDVPHGDVGGLASTPNVQFPHLPPIRVLPFSGGSNR